LTTFNDARFDALLVLVPAAPPTTNDMLFAWLATEGGTGNTLVDRWYSMLLSKNVVSITGLHDTLPDSDFLFDSSSPFGGAGDLDGFRLRNLTDSSETIITGSNPNNLSGDLVGGTDNEWDIGDAYIVFLLSHRSDMWKAVLADNGFAQATLKDAEFAYWVAGGPALT
jgi:hypothetical protein